MQIGRAHVAVAAHDGYVGVEHIVGGAEFVEVSESLFVFTYFIIVLCGFECGELAGIGA